MRNLFKFIIVLVFTSITNYASSKDFRSNEISSTAIKEQDAIIDSVKGCWRNMETGSWDIAFMEKYAIYDCKLWQYYKISKKGRKNNTKITLTLKNEDKTVLVKLSKETDSICNIAIDNNKSVLYNLCGKVLGDYPFKDTSSLTRYPYRKDTVSFSGILHSSSKDKKPKGEISFYALISEIEQTFPIKLDSLGYFNIKIPIINSQEIVFSGSTYNSTYIEPEKRYFFFFDMDTKQALMMGDDVRVQNEILTHRLSLPSAYGKYQEVTADDFLKFSKENLRKRKQIVKDYINKYPTLSERYRYWRDDISSYKIAYYMAQKRFYLKSGDMFSDEYMDFMKQNFIDKAIYPKTISGLYDSFLRNYIPFSKEGFKTGTSTSTSISLPPFDKVVSELEKMQLDTFTLREKELIHFYCHNYIDSVTYYKYIKEDSIAANRYSEKYSSFADSLGKVFKAHPILHSEKATIIRKRIEFERELKKKREETRLEFEKIKEKSQSDEVSQIAISKHIYKQLESSQDALDTMTYIMFHKYVTNDALKHTIVTLQNKFENINNEEFIGASINSDESITDGEQLFNKIIAPHKGKVIFLDIWGTWCAPCRNQMKHMGKIKDGLKGKDVVFVYLASNSPEKSWKNTIISLEVDGKENIHYNLPSEQQQMLEKFIGIKGYPTYRLIDRKGKIAHTNPPWPSTGQVLIDEIKRILDK